MTIAAVDTDMFLQIVDGIEQPCDYAFEVACPDQPARWIMHRKPCCPAKLHPALACDKCKEDRLMDHFSLECEFCGHIFEHAPDAYRYIEPLERRP